MSNAGRLDAAPVVLHNSARERWSIFEGMSLARSPYQGVILAAGHGSRMGPFGDALPKPIAPICNKPLIAYQLDHLKSLGIDDVIVVIGHLGHRIIQTLGDGSAYGVKITYVEQEKRLGLAHAVGQLEGHIDRPFMLILGDIFFEMPELRRMADIFESGETEAVLAVKEETDPEAVKRNFAVLLRDDGTVRRVIEKPRHVPNLLKGCGIYLFGPPIFDAIRRTPRTAMRDEYELTDSIQILIDYEYEVRVADVVEWDMNLTYPADLIECCVYQLKKLGQSNLIGEGASVNSGATLKETVVGEHARIDNANLERCVVLPNVEVAGPERFRNTIFTEAGPIEA